MSLKEEIKQEAKIERQKFQKMSRQDKIWYIWEYYKFHIAAVLGIIGVICIIATSIYNNTFSTVLYAIVVNNRTNQETVDFEPLTTGFHEYMGYGKKDEIFAESMFISYDDMSEFSYASMAKVSALIASKELDVMISDKEYLDHYIEMDGLMHLEDVLPADLSEQLKDRFYYGTDESGQTYVAGIDISGTDFAASTGIVLEPALYSVVSNTLRTDTAIALLRYIFGL